MLPAWQTNAVEVEDALVAAGIDVIKLQYEIFKRLEEEEAEARAHQARVAEGAEGGGGRPDAGGMGGGGGGGAAPASGGGGRGRARAEDSTGKTRASVERSQGADHEKGASAEENVAAINARLAYHVAEELNEFIEEIRNSSDAFEVRW